VSAPFAKLKLDMSFTSACSKGRFLAGYGGISYYELLGDIPQELLDVVQPDRARFVEICGPVHVGPHRDQMIKTSLNMYTQPGDCYTQYWMPRVSAIVQRRRVPTSDSRWTKPEVVEWTGFRARPGDSYLLDVTKIHSVERDKSAVRQFVQLSWLQTRYETIFERLKGFVTDS
jgi:hypothetical protein